MRRLVQHHGELWTVAAPRRFLENARMTLVRLPSGSLWVHSPVALDDALVVELEELGEVSAVVAPNRFHHLHAGSFLEAFPKARLYGAPGLGAKRPDLPLAGELEGQQGGDWSGALDQVLIEGAPSLSEVVFFHRASRTLISCDLVLNIRQPKSFLTSVYLRLIGLHGRAGFSPLLKFAYRDRKRARACIGRVLGWDFDRLILSHGEVVESGGREVLRNSFAWLLES